MDVESGVTKRRGRGGVGSGDLTVEVETPCPTPLPYLPDLSGSAVPRLSERTFYGQLGY